MAKETKGKKIYHLEICFDDSTSKIEYIKEYIDASNLSVVVGEVDLSDYFDDETLKLIEDCYVVGDS
jgi:hypothetical protein